MKTLKLMVAMSVVFSFATGAFAGDCCGGGKKDGKKGPNCKDEKSTSTVSVVKVENKKA